MALKISKSRITVGSDGLLLADLTDAAGAGISPADYKFRIELYGSQEASLRGCATEISDANKYVISYDGTERKNCKLVDGRLYILVKRYSLKSGIVYYSQYESFEDQEFEDQEYRQVAYGTLDLTITTDGSSTADQTAFVTISSAALKGEAGDDYVLTDQDKQDIAKLVDVEGGGSITIDSTPTENSDNAVSSGGVYKALQEIGDINLWEQCNTTQSYVSASSPAKTINTTVDHRSMTHDVEVNDTEVFRLQIWNPNQVDNTVEEVESRISNRFAFYDEELTKIIGYIDISSLDGSAYQTQLVKVPKGAYWVRFGLIMGYSGDDEQTFDEDIKAMISRGTNALEYRPSEADLLSIVQSIIEIDEEVTQNSLNPVSSGGVYDAIDQSLGNIGAYLATI